MHAFEIHLEDWKRILFGNIPGIFYLEVFFRVTFIYLLILFCMRLMGKRMASMLSRNEILSLSALAAAIGIPLQNPERGLLPAIIMALIVVAGQRLIAYISTRSEKFERQSQGNIAILIKDCCLQMQVMKETRISRERLYAQLRSDGITHLGKVKRLYFEASGEFSLVLNPEESPGLCVIPEEDTDFIRRQHIVKDKPVCRECGKHREPADQAGCSNCGNDTFIAAIA